MPADDERLGSWLRARSRDIDLDSMSVLRADVQAAPTRLEAELARLDALPDSDVVIRQRYAAEGALELARRVAADAGSMAEFREWLRSASEEGFIAAKGHEEHAVRAYLTMVLDLSKPTE